MNSSIAVKSSECRVRNVVSGLQPEWWRGVPEGERALIQSLAGLLRSAKRSQVREVAQAARKWERGLGCFIKVRLMNERRWRGRCG